MIRNFGFRRSVPSAFGTATPLYNSVGVVHNFAPATADIPLRVNGALAQPMRRNPVDGMYYSAAWLPETTLSKFTCVDPATGRINTVSATTLTTPTRPTVSRTRWVAPVAVGAGDYSNAANAGALATALNSELDGDRIICVAGTYYVGDHETGAMTIGSGKAVILEADASAIVVLSGFREAQPSSWTNEGSGEYSTTDFDVNCRLLCFVETGKNQQLAWKDTRVALQAASHGWTIDASTLYVKLPGALDPNSETMKISADAKHGVTCNGDGSLFEDLIFEGYGAGTGTNSRSLIIAGDNVTVLNCSFRDIHDEGIRISGATDTLIDGCTHSMERKYISFADIKEVTAKYRTESGAGLVINGENNVTVRNCTFRDHMDAMNVLGVSNHVDIENNTFTDCYGETISIEGASTQVKRWSNVFTRTENFLGFAVAETGPFWIINDNGLQGGLTAIDTNAAASMLLQGTKFNLGSSGNVGMIVMINCTLDASNPGFADYTDARTVSIENMFVIEYWLAENCIFAGMGHAFFEENTVQGNFLFDRNRWWTSNGYGHATPWKWGNTLAVDFATFQAASGLETNGSYGDPNLDDKIPKSSIAGTYQPGITGNATLGNLTSDVGAQ